MGLLQNGFRDRVGVYRIYGAGVSNGAYPYTLVGNSHLTGRQRNLRAGEGITSPLVGIPSGHLAPSSWMLPQRSGAMTAFTSCRGLGGAVANPAAGIGIVGESVGVGTASASVVGLGWGTGGAAASGSATGSMLGAGFISGESAGEGSAAANIFAAVAITGLAEGSCAVLGDGYLAISLTGTANGGSTVYGSAAALINTSGTAEGTSAASAEVVGAYFATGLAEGAGAADGGEPIGLGWLDGEAPGSCSASLQPSALGFMAGTTDTASGELTADGVARAVWNYTI